MAKSVDSLVIEAPQVDIVVLRGKHQKIQMLHIDAAKQRHARAENKKSPWEASETARLLRNPSPDPSHLTQRSAKTAAPIDNSRPSDRTQLASFARPIG